MDCVTQDDDDGSVGTLSLPGTVVPGVFNTADSNVFSDEVLCVTPATSLVVSSICSLAVNPHVRIKIHGNEDLWAA